MCCEESDFSEHSLNLRSWFLKRGYPEKIIKTEMSKGVKRVFTQKTYGFI